MLFSAMDNLRIKDSQFIDSDQRVDTSFRESASTGRRTDGGDTERRRSEIKPFLEQLRSMKDEDLIRTETIKELSRLIEKGAYETEERLDRLADRLLDELL